MKTPLSLCLMVAAASTLSACSSDEGADRNAAPLTPTAGTTGAPVGAGGTTGAPVGAGGTTGAPVGAGGTGPVATANLGAPLTITATPTGANVVDEAGDTQVDGGVILAQSATMTTPATVAHRDGALCMSGETAVVPDDSSYGTHWGAELSLDLMLVPVAGSAPPPPVADAGADAGPAAAGELEPGAWPMGEVIGFAFTVEGSQLPASFRFKGLPTGSNPELETFCNQVTNLATSPAQEIGFDEITFECWNAGNPSLADAEIPTVAVAGAAQSTRANPRTLRSISWQVPADLNSTYPFDFCITDLRPMLAP